MITKKTYNLSIKEQPAVLETRTTLLHWFPECTLVSTGLSIKSFNAEIKESDIPRVEGLLDDARIDFDIIIEYRI